MPEIFLATEDVMRIDENVNALERTGDHVMHIGVYITSLVMSKDIHYISIKEAVRDLVS